jgi:hypothetical protein
MGDISDEQTASHLAPRIAIAPKLTAALGELGADAPVYLFVGAYTLIVYVLSVSLHDVKTYQPLMYLLAWAFFSLIFLTAIWAIRATRTDPRRPFSALPVIIVRQHLNRDSVLGIPLMVASGIFYGVFTSTKMTALIEIGSVRLGWHYVTDGVAGVAIAAISWHVAGIAEQRWLKWYAAHRMRCARS